MKQKCLALVFFGCLLLANTFALAEEGLMTKRSEQIRDFFTRLNTGTMNLVDEFYDEKVDFSDPVEHFTNRGDLKRYYENMYRSVESIQFEYRGEVAQGDTHVLIWVMILKTPKLNGGKEIRVQGNSVLTFGGAEGKVIYHRDYFDMGEFIYERVPVVGFLVRKIKGRLALHP